MDGLTFLEKLMSRSGAVVVCSGLTGPRTEAAIRAPWKSARGHHHQTQVGIRGFLEESAVFCSKIPASGSDGPG